MSTTEFNLSDRYDSTEGTVAMTGIQAIIRVPLDQKRADAGRGLNTAALISGYRGSPVGGIDIAYEQDQELLEGNDIKFISGVNEDLGATMVWGTQSVEENEDRTHDGVMGMWYGKGPGVDRSGDVLRHANTAGSSPTGGVLVIAGDDPACKSSTIASASEWSLADLAIPVLYPANVQDILDFGRVGYELSRYSGAWIAMKIHTNVADAYTTVQTDPSRLQINPVDFEVDGKSYTPRRGDSLIAPFSLTLEAEMFGNRLAAVKAFMAAQTLDRVIGAQQNARIGIVVAGPVYGETRDALARMGFTTDEDLADAGIRLYKPAMIWPLEASGLTAFADGLEEIVVIEEKRSFIEAQIRDTLYGRTGAPRVLGKVDDEGLPLFPTSGALIAEDVTAPLKARLRRLVDEAKFAPERKLIPLTNAPSGTALPSRSPYFCSGCPHNRSTVVPEGSKGGGGIGCHTMSLGMNRNTAGVTHMGGEGAQWVGIEPFVKENHRYQNLGDGTLAHSGYLAIRQAVSAKSNITYKILYNGTVAMTGGQDAAGEMAVPQLTRALEAEGVERIVVVADDVNKYDDDATWADNSRIEHRDRLDDVQLELRDVPGVTVLVYDQACAAELRRGRKRGTIETPTTRIMINEDICEGCGDCGVVSNCASVHPVDTPFGRKTRIHQESCNFDLTCLGGNCPAFISVEIDPDYKPTKAALVGIPDGDLPADPVIPAEGNVLLVGIGGTGVVTINQVIATAALLDGKHSTGLDQTGLAQKGGPVVSNLRITTEAAETSNRVGEASADAMLIFDLLTGANRKNITRADPERTVAIVSTGLVPTGNMVSGRGAESFPELDRFKDKIDQYTRSADNVWLDASGIARRVFASQPAANVMVVGLAYQKGVIPVSAESIEKAIEINGVAVDTNIEAFRLGRRIAADPALMDSLDAGSSLDEPAAAPVLGGLAAQIATPIIADEALSEILAYRIPELIQYQDKKYAKAYAADIARVRNAELALGGDHSELSQNVARMLFKLMAYKDEYEVARLALKSDVAEQARRRFGPDAKVSFQLKPPTLKNAGIDRKLPIPEAAGRKMFQGLVAGKKVRGTKLDPFGRTEERRIERQLIGEYRQLIDRLLAGLTVDTYDQAAEIAYLADQVRGYDTVKLANVDNYRAAVTEAMATYGK